MAAFHRGGPEIFPSPEIFLFYFWIFKKEKIRCQKITKFHRGRPEIFPSPEIFLRHANFILINFKLNCIMPAPKAEHQKQQH